MSGAGLFIFHLRNQSDHIDQVLLFHSDASEIPATRGLDFALLGIFTFGGLLPLGLVQLVLSLLFRCGYFVFNRLLVIWSSTIRACRFLVGGLEAVETELADLQNNQFADEGSVKGHRPGSRMDTV